VPLLYAFVVSAAQHAADAARLASASLAGLAAAAVAGWYYVRNWIAFGSPFALGTPGRSVVRAAAWWQEPGYRLVAQLVAFGSGLVRPFDAASHGFWDNYYSTLWADGRWAR
jgi:hypothetical protein